VRPPPILYIRPCLISFYIHPATSAKYIFKKTLGTVFSSSSPRSSPYQQSLHPKVHSDNCQHPPHNFRAQNHSQSPNRRRNGKNSHAQRAYNLSDVIGRYGTRRAKRGYRAGDGRAGTRPRRPSGCTKFPPTPVRLSTIFFFFTSIE
jgi:hypothetical protein